MTLKPQPASGKNPASAMMTPKTAHDAPCAGLRAGIRRALDVSRVQKSGFVDRQIAIHQEFQSRKVEKLKAANRLQFACMNLESFAQDMEWSQRKLAGQLGLKESTWRKIKAGNADSKIWLPKLEAAVTRMIGGGNLPLEVAS